MTLALFTIPKPFVGHIGNIQLNAVRSWKARDPAIEVILLGDEEGIADAAKNCSCRVVKGIRKNAFGTPLVSDAFRLAEKKSSADILCFIHIPPFAIGRMAFDNWLIFAGVDAGATVIDATAQVLAVHQNHNHDAQGEERISLAVPEVAENARLTGYCGFGCEDSTHVLTSDGIVRRSPAHVRRRVERGIAHYPHLRPLLIPLLYWIRMVNRAWRTFFAGTT